METYKFIINGLRHHDFKDKLDELYEFAPGHRMSISIEHDNAHEEDAVIVYLGSKCVGYVRSGADRKRACSLLRSSGRGSLLGKIVGVERKNRWLYMEVTTACEVSKTVDDRKNILSGWEFDGKLLPMEESVHRLHAMLDNLKQVLECEEPWDEDMEEWLLYVEENMWRDISKECSEKVSEILTLLSSGGAHCLEYSEKASRLQYSIDYMASPEVRRFQAQQIIERAHSRDMDLLLLHYGERAKEKILQLPPELKKLFLQDGEVFMGRIWYLHCPYRQVSAILTILSMIVRIQDNEGECASDNIPRKWLMEWARKSENSDCAEFVHKVVSDYDLSQRNPQLLKELQLLESSCRPSLNIHTENIEMNNAGVSKQDFNFNGSVGYLVGHANSVIPMKDDHSDKSDS